MSAWNVYPITGLKGFTMATCSKLKDHKKKENCLNLYNWSLVLVKILGAVATDLAYVYKML
jgi:hypothetical protein